MSSNNSGSGGGGRGDFPITITARDVGIDQSIAKLTRFSEALRQTGAAVQQSMQMINQFGQGMANFGRGTQQLNQGFSQGATSANQFNQAITNTINNVRNGQTTMTQYMNTQRQTAQTTQQAAMAQTTLTASTQRMNQTFQQTAASLGTAQGKMRQLNQNLNQNSQSMNNAIANTVRYNSENMKVAGSTTAASSAADKSSTSYNNVGNALGGVTRMMTGTIMSSTMLALSLQESIGMNEMLAAGEQSLADAKQKTLEALERYGEESTQHQRALKQEADVTRGLAYTQRNANFAMGDALFFIIMMTTSVSSKLIPALTNWSETSQKLHTGFNKFLDIISAMPSKFGGFTAALGLNSAAQAVNNTVLTSAGASATKNTIQIGALSTAQVVDTGTTNILSAAWARLTAIAAAATPVFTRMWVAITGPIGLTIIAVLAAISAALLAIQSDFMGVRTKLEEFGKAAGEQVPILHPFLEAIQGVGAQLGLTGESAEEASEHFATAGRGFEKMSELWTQTVGQMQESSNQLVRTVGNAAAILTTDWENARNDFQNQLKATTNTWNEFVDAMSKGDFERAVDIIIESVSALPDIIVTSLSHLGEQIWDTLVAAFNVLNALGEEIKPYFEKAWEMIVGLATEVGTRIYDELIKGIAPILSWIQTSIITPIQNFFNNIASGLGDIADSIILALGLTNLPFSAKSLADDMGQQIKKVADFVGDISAAVWDALKLQGLVDKATTLAQDIWAAITGFFDSASAQSKSNLESGTSPSLTGDQMQDIVDKSDQDRQDKAKKLNDQGYYYKDGQLVKDNTLTSLPSQTTTTPTPTMQTGEMTRLSMQKAKQTAPTPAPTQSPKPQGLEFTSQQTRQALQNAKSDPALKPQTQQKAKGGEVLGYSKEIPKFPTTAGGTLGIINKGMEAQGQSTMSAAERQASVLAEAAKEYEGLDEKIKDAGNAGLDFVNKQGQIPEVLMQNTHALADMGIALGEQKNKNDALEHSLYSTGLALEHGYMQTLMFTSGQLEQQKVLQDMEMEIETNRGALEVYAKQVEEGTIKNFAFTLGQQEQRKALLDSQVEIAHTNGVLQEMALQLEEGSLQQVAFTQGQQEITKHYMDMEVETANLSGKFTELTSRFGDGKTAYVEFSNGLAQGRLEMAENIMQMENAKGVYEGNRDVLIDYSKAVGLPVNPLRLTNAALLDFIGVARGAPDALAELVGWFSGLGDAISQNAYKAFDEGKDAWEEFIESMEKELHFKVSPELELAFKRDAIVSELKSDTETALGAVSILWKSQNIDIQGPAIKNVASGMFDQIKEQMKTAEGETKTILFNMYNAWKNILEKPMSATTLIESLNTIRASFAALGDSEMVRVMDGFIASVQAPFEQATASIGSFSDKLQETTPVVTNFGTIGVSAGTGFGAMATGAENAGNAAEQADPQMQQFYQTISQFGAIESVMITIWEQNFPQHVLNGTAAALGHVNQFALNVDGVWVIMKGSVENFFLIQIPAAAGIMVGALQNHFTVLQAQFGTIMGQMITTSQQSFKAIGDYAAQVPTISSTHFRSAQSTMGTIMGQMITTASKSFKAIGDSAKAVPDSVAQYFGKASSDGKSLIDALKRSAVSAFDDIASRAKSAADGIKKIGDSASDAKSKVDSLRSSVNSLPNVNRTITYTIRTVGSRPAGAQFGINSLVDKPTFILAGEGWGKERVKVQPGTMAFVEDFTKEMSAKFGQFLNDPKNSNQNISINRQSNTGTGGKISQTQTNSQKSTNKNNVNIQSSTNTQSNVSGIPVPPGGSNSNNSNQNISINRQSNTGTGGRITQSQSVSQTSSNGQNNYNYQSDVNTESNVSGVPIPPGIIASSKSRLLRQGDPLAHKTRVVHETPIDVQLNIDGSRLARKLVKLITEELGMYGSGYYG